MFFFFVGDTLFRKRLRLHRSKSDWDEIRQEPASKNKNMIIRLCDHHTLGLTAFFPRVCDTKDTCMYPCILRTTISLNRYASSVCRMLIRRPSPWAADDSLPLSSWLRSAFLISAIGKCLILMTSLRKWSSFLLWSDFFPSVADEGRAGDGFGWCPLPFSSTMPPQTFGKRLTEDGVIALDAIDEQSCNLTTDNHT